MKRVLIAEDDKFLASAYKLKLTKMGVDCRVVGDGNMALAALEEYKPDLVLLDLIMPNKDGFATLAEIKNQDKWKELPVLVASNLGQAEDMKKAEDLGAAGYIVKSNTSIESLVGKIKQVLGV